VRWRRCPTCAAGTCHGGPRRATAIPRQDARRKSPTFFRLLPLAATVSDAARQRPRKSAWPFSSANGLPTNCAGEGVSYARRPDAEAERGRDGVDRGTRRRPTRELAGGTGGAALPGSTRAPRCPSTGESASSSCAEKHGACGPAPGTATGLAGGRAKKSLFQVAWNEAGSRPSRRPIARFWPA
jgi:hypothetical protein